MNDLGRKATIVPAKSENPYDTPKANGLVLASEFEYMTPAHRTFRVLAWVLWAALVLSFLWDLAGMLSLGSLAQNHVSKGRFLLFILIAAGQVTLVVFMRWIVFRLMMRTVDPVGWGGAVRCIVGAFVVYGMVKVLEIAGVRLWSDSGRWVLYLCFATPSFILAALFIPGRLVDYVSSRKMGLTWQQ